MTGRRQRIGDAAVEVLATHGLRGLTHRAVDAAAGLPAGSTSNIFRTRAALITGVIDRLAEQDLAFVSELRQSAPDPDAGMGATDLDTVLSLMVRAATVMTRPPMDRMTRARMMLAFEEAADLGPQHRNMILALMGMLSELGHPNPGPAARAVVDYLDGAMLHALTMEARRVDPAEMRNVLRTLMSCELQPTDPLGTD
jgi:DNA-binding transcriptional regulator YbjK